MTTTYTHRRLTTALCTALLLGASVHAQFIDIQHPAGIEPPPDFGASLLFKPVDEAVMGWCNTPVSWVYVTDEVGNKIVRWVMTPSGTPAVPYEWSSFSEGPFGIAVNDIPGHVHQDTVYATGINFDNEPCVQAFTRFGVPLSVLFKGNPSDPF